LKAKRPGFTDERYQETSYYMENGERFGFPSRNVIKNAFINRSSQGIPILLYIHNLHERPLGRRKDFGYILSGVPSTSCRGIRAMHSNGHFDSQLREGTH